MIHHSLLHIVDMDLVPLPLLILLVILYGPVLGVFFPTVVVYDQVLPLKQLLLLFLNVLVMFPAHHYHSIVCYREDCVSEEHEDVVEH